MVRRPISELFGCQIEFESVVVVRHRRGQFRSCCVEIFLGYQGLNLINWHRVAGAMLYQRLGLGDSHMMIANESSLLVGRGQGEAAFGVGHSHCEGSLRRLEEHASVCEWRAVVGDYAFDRRQVETASI